MLAVLYNRLLGGKIALGDEVAAQLL